jgi:paired amphipathic helix protein Sin3a
MDELKLKERWQYYISSFIRIEPTEGVPRSRLRKVVLARNLPSADADIEDGGTPKPVSYSEDLTVSVCLKSSKMVFKAGTSEYFIYDNTPKTAEAREQREKFTPLLSQHREAKLKKDWVHQSPWTKNLSPVDVQKTNQRWTDWVEKGIVPPQEDDPMDTTE